MSTTKANGSNLPAVFSYGEKNKLTAIMVNYTPYFIAKDACDVLGLSHVKNATAKLDDDEKLNVKTLRSGQERYCIAVNESGLYNLIFRSNKPEAKNFRRWVTNEVLPALRKQGSYNMPGQVTIKDAQRLPVAEMVFGEVRIPCVVHNGTAYCDVDTAGNVLGIAVQTIKAHKSIQRIPEKHMPCMVVQHVSNTSKTYITETGLIMLCKHVRTVVAKTILKVAMADGRYNQTLAPESNTAAIDGALVDLIMKVEDMELRNMLWLQYRKGGAA